MLTELPVYTRPDECLSAWKFVHLTFPFTWSKKFVHLTFPFTWEVPESIRKAAFRIPTAEIVVHRSTDSNIKTTFLLHRFIFLYGTQRKRGGLHGTGRIFNRYKSEFVRFRRWTKIWADRRISCEREAYPDEFSSWLTFVRSRVNGFWLRFRAHLGPVYTRPDEC